MAAGASATRGQQAEVFVRLPHSWCGASAVGVMAVADAAESLGFDGVSVQDHVLSSHGTSPCGTHHFGDDRDVLDPLATLSFVAARTTRVKLLTGVIVLPFHHPVRLAKLAGTVDVLSGGRLVLGVGIGWPRARKADEMQKMSLHADLAGRETAIFDPPSPRWKLMDESLVALDRLWREDVATYSGELIQFDGLDLRPQTVQRPHPPIWVGGRAEAVYRRAGELADGWFPSQAPVEFVASGRQRVIEYARRAGRPEPMIAVNLFVSIDSSRAVAHDVMRDGLGHRFQTDEGLFQATIAGDPGDVRQRMLDYVAAGCTAFDIKILPLATEDTLAQMQLLAREVLPVLGEQRSFAI